MNWKRVRYYYACFLCVVLCATSCISVVPGLMNSGELLLRLLGFAVFATVVPACIYGAMYFFHKGTLE